MRLLKRYLIFLEIHIILITNMNIKVRWNLNSSRTCTFLIIPKFDFENGFDLEFDITNLTEK